MKTVYIYGGTGTYHGVTDFEWASPEIGNRHDFMLFIAQDLDTPQEIAACLELEKFGFGELELMEGRPIIAETLNDPAMQAFQKHYEGAFNEGSSLVWYPQPKN
jgi:hypothetical protein